MTDATSPAPAAAPPTVFDETALQVARPYAEALVNAAGKAYEEKRQMQSIGE